MLEKNRQIALVQKKRKEKKRKNLALALEGPLLLGKWFVENSKKLLVHQT